MQKGPRMRTRVSFPYWLGQAGTQVGEIMSFLDVHALPSLTYYSLNGLLHSLRYRLLPLERYAGYPCCIGRDFTWRSSAGERFQKFNTKIAA